MKLTPKQLAELIAQVIAKLVAAGKDPESITTEDIMAEIDAVLAAADGDGAVAEGEDKGDDDSPAVTPEFISQVLEALKACQKSSDDKPDAKSGEGDDADKKGGEGPSAQKSAPADSGVPAALATAAAAHAAPSMAPTPQRKYASLFLSTGAAHNAGASTGFKARIESMSDRERRKTTLGMFGRAVKCIHASHGDPEHRVCQCRWQADRHVPQLPRSLRAEEQRLC